MNMSKSMAQDSMILIPARMASSRLPGKPLAPIAGEAMIVHVWRRAVEADLGRVVVATDSPEIMDEIRKAGGEAVITGSHHQSGSDRIFEALEICDPQAGHDVIINLQGDLPLISPQTIRAAAGPLAQANVDIATLASPIREEREKTDPNVVKVVSALERPGDVAQALYFTRAAAPHGEGPLFHHIGIYAWRRRSLARFVALAPSRLERREKLEQLRALEAGMRIDVACVDTFPLGVDTPADLKRAEKAFHDLSR